MKQYGIILKGLGETGDFDAIFKAEDKDKAIEEFLSILNLGTTDDVWTKDDIKDKVFEVEESLKGEI